ncbi:hypothetical protein MSG28_012692 [Choristoneura fumiferana]|uniref:Uncharacterized protein n=1 Tax=Choristoneura fumiferana TaxID=7141 RepID=A0ACC0JHU4_CHOFU|nr:hypothetical protein MSG28_012692 [Choristoneura fumiferana]
MLRRSKREVFVQQWTSPGVDDDDDDFSKLEMDVRPHVLLTGAPLAVLGSMLLVQQQGGTAPPWVPVVCIGICLFASGQNLPLPYVVMSEIFSVQELCYLKMPETKGKTFAQIDKELEELKGYININKFVKMESL